MTALDLDAIRARADAATPGPWGGSCGAILGYHGQYIADVTQDGNDEAFIRAARTDIPVLLAERDALAAKVKRLQTEAKDLQWAVNDAERYAKSIQAIRATLTARVAELEATRTGVGTYVEAASAGLREIEKLTAERDALAAEVKQLRVAIQDLGDWLVHDVIGHVHTRWERPDIEVTELVKRVARHLVNHGWDADAQDMRGCYSKVPAIIAGLDAACCPATYTSPEHGTVTCQEPTDHLGDHHWDGQHGDCNWSNTPATTTQDCCRDCVTARDNYDAQGCTKHHPTDIPQPWLNTPTPAAGEQTGSGK